MRAHVLQHVPFETPAIITPWLESAGASIETTRLYETHRLPQPRDVEFLVIMGGPMSVNDEVRRPWLVPEKQFIRRVIEAGTPVLGICLGSQLIASAMGARVYPHGEPEIGWFPIEAVPDPPAGSLRLPPELMVFHWHGETLDLPDGAVHLARSTGCAHQIFQLGDTVVGLQCHLEVTPEAVGAMVEHGRAELVPARFVQSADDILSAGHAMYPAANAVMADVLSHVTQGCRA